LLIIFDLDDTLIDTSGSITPITLKRALTRLVECGFSPAPFTQLLEELYGYNKTAENAGEAIEKLLEKYGCKKRFLEQALEYVYAPFTEDILVHPLPDALCVLQDLQRRHTLAIVSSGRLTCQLQKMEKAGIDTTLFSKICVCTGKEKKHLYQTVCQELGVSAHDTVVCGDRIERDLEPAKELGCVTVQMLWGRGLSSFQTGQHRQVTGLLEFSSFIASWGNKV